MELLHDRNKGGVVLGTLGRSGRPPRVVARTRHPQLDAHESHRIGIGVRPVRDRSQLHCLPFANQVATFFANSTCICNSAIVALSSLSPARNRINSSRSDPVSSASVSYTHLRAHETRHDLVCRLLLEKKKNTTN